MTEKVLQPTTSTEESGSALGTWLTQRQLEISLALVSVVLLVNTIAPPQYFLATSHTLSPSHHLKDTFSRFLFLSYEKPGGTGESLYYKGRDDAFFVVFYFVLFWFLRDASIRWVWEPLAGRFGITSKRAVARFAEQGWALLYFSVFWSIGMYIMQTSPYKNLETKNFYVDYPHDALSALSKWYYLTQTAFWLQQLVVLNLEEHRKDYAQMFTHHVVTVLLMTFSYVLNWTRVGNAILCIMDFVDILLPLAKLFVYTKHPKLADFVFILFVTFWIFTRHILYNIVLYSYAFELPKYLPHGWRSEEGYFNAGWSHAGFTTLLAIQQVILLIWFKLIVKVAWKVMQGHPGEDTRSEAGDDEVESLEVEEGDIDLKQGLLDGGAEVKQVELEAGTVLEKNKDQ